MSSDEVNGNDHSLDRLLHPLQRRSRRDFTSGTDPCSEPQAAKGLSPLDALALPPEQREIVNWLSRRREARFSEIQQALAKEPEQIVEILSVFKEAGYIHEALVDGEVHYRVVFRGTVRRAGRGLGKEIWDRLQLDNAAFLGQVPLFQDLPHQERERIAGQLEERRYRRNGVILWQGDPVDHLYLIKRGIVGIARLSSRDHRPHILAYLEQGQVLGEVGLLVAQSSTATVTALTEVQMLLMKRRDFFDLLAKHSGVAVELARIMGQRLSDTNARLTRTAADANLCLLLGVGTGAGATTLGSAMALTLAHMTGGQTVYTEYPAPERLARLFGFAREVELYHHLGGYDIFVPQYVPGIPSSAQATLLVDHLLNNYANIVIGLLGSIDSKVACMLEHADQLIIVTPPDQESWALVADLCASLKAFTHPEKTRLFTVVNRGTHEYRAVPAPGRANFDIPFLETIPSLANQRYDNLPQSLTEVTRALADSLGRTNKISVYIPTTIDVDQYADTTVYVEKTLAFLGGLFGGAASKQVHGVWNSDEAGLINEAIYVVQSFVTQLDMDRYLVDVVEYVEWLKQELKQEAMALEINQKLMLI